MPGNIKRSLRVSFLDGLFAACMVGFTADYITPYALSLKATTFQIGLLAAIPSFISSFAQLRSADLVDRLKSRKRLIVIFIFLHTIILIPIILLPYLFKWKAVYFYIGFVTLFVSLGAFAGPAWASLMSDHIPHKKRGHYFGWRNKISAAVTIISAFGAGFILNIYKLTPLKGFMIIFFIAFIARMISWYYLTRMYEPRYGVSKEAYFSFFKFISKAKVSNFTKFVIFVSVLNFSVNLASPFFSVFMLRDLKFNYLTYTAIVVTVTFVHILLLNRWGVHADRFGNIRVIRFCAFFIACLPFLWVINQHPLFRIFAQIVSGFAWSGFNLCALNFIYDAVTPQKRTRCIAYFNVLTGFTLCLGALMGGWLAQKLPALFGFKLLSLFLLSSILRMGVVLLFFRKFREVRKAEHIKAKDLFYSISGIDHLLGLNVWSKGKGLPQEE